MENKDLKIGDLVMLNSGGCYMTVIDFDTKTSSSRPRYVVAFTNEYGAFTLSVYGNALTKLKKEDVHGR